MAKEADDARSHPGESRWRMWLTRRGAVLVAALLIAFFLQVILSSRLMSVTVDEFAHLPAGYIYWQRGDFAVYRRNPPLMKMWAALPLFRSGLDKRFVNDSNLWAAGRHFMLHNEPMYHALFVRCRIMIALLGVGLGYLVYRWSRELFGVPGGLLSLAVYAFSPNLIAHSGLVTSDVGAAAMYALACYVLFKLDEKWTVWRLALVGLAFGLAMITKFSCLALLPLAPLVLVLQAIVRRRDPARPGLPWRTSLARGVVTLAVIAVAGLLIINAGYGFSGSFKPWRAFDGEGQPLASLATSPIAPLPAPFPEQFLLGLVEQKQAAFDPQFQYFHGHASYEAWWYYWVMVFLLKVPIPTLALLALAAYAGARRLDRRVLVFLVLPALFFVALFSAKLLRIRWQLPILPLAFISFGALVRKDAPAPIGRPVFLAGIGALVLWLAIESAITFPHYIAYFNEFAGGHGERYLVDCNCDWGQDHLTLRRFMRRKGLESVHLATLGRVDAAVYGVEYETLRPNEPVTGDVVISVNLLAGNPYLIPDNRRPAIRVPEDGYAWLRAHKPVRRIGGSLYYFRIEAGPDKHEVTTP